MSLLMLRVGVPYTARSIGWIDGAGVKGAPGTNQCELEGEGYVEKQEQVSGKLLKRLGSEVLRDGKGVSGSGKMSRRTSGHAQGTECVGL